MPRLALPLGSRLPEISPLAFFMVALIERGLPGGHSDFVFGIIAGRLRPREGCWQVLRHLRIRQTTAKKTISIRPGARNGPGKSSICSASSTAAGVSLQPWMPIKRYSS